MKHFRKSFLTLLALTLFGGAGAWAQGPTVTELTVPNNWFEDPTTLTAADLPGFVAVDSATADQWEYASTSGSAMLIYGFTTDGKVKYVYFDLGTKTRGTYLFNRSSVYGMGSTTQFFYTTGAGAIELTKVGDNQWSLGQTPDYDVELQVEYYQKHALKNIPAGWTVKVNGVDQTSAIVGDSLMITETDSVTLIPAGNPRRVKSVTLADDAPVVQTITVAGLQLNYVEGENWVQTAQRNPGVITIDGSYVNKMNGSYFLMTSSVVSPTSTYDPSLGYWWQEW